MNYLISYIYEVRGHVKPTLGSSFFWRKAKTLQLRSQSRRLGADRVAGAWAAVLIAKGGPRSSQDDATSGNSEPCTGPRVSRNVEGVRSKP